MHVSRTTVDVAKRRAALIAAAELMVKESGDPGTFDGAKWLNEWLTQPVPALGWRCPADYLGTDEGCEMLILLLQRTKDGVYC